MQNEVAPLYKNGGYTRNQDMTPRTGVYSGIATSYRPNQGNYGSFSKEGKTDDQLAIEAANDYLNNYLMYESSNPDFFMTQEDLESGAQYPDKFYSGYYGAFPVRDASGNFVGADVNAAAVQELMSEAGLPITTTQGGFTPLESDNTRMVNPLQNTTQAAAGRISFRRNGGYSRNMDSYTEYAAKTSNPIPKSVFDARAEVWSKNRDAINQNALQQAMRMQEAGIFANVVPLAVSPNTTAGQMLYDTAAVNAMNRMV
jgi:hypothetical protein